MYLCIGIRHQVKANRDCWKMKFSTSQFTISTSYEQELHERQAIFEESEKIAETVVHTFVTTYGVKDGIHKSIVHSEVTMEDLFAE